MPSYTNIERVMILMRYMHQNPNKRHTVDSLAYELGIPSASIRKTLEQEFKPCFSKKGRDIYLTGLLPVGVSGFDLDAELLTDILTPFMTPQTIEPSTMPTPKEITNKRKAEYFVPWPVNEEGKLALTITTKKLEGWIVRGVPTEDKEAAMRLRNHAQWLSLVMEVVHSSNPKRTIEKYVENPENFDPKYWLGAMYKVEKREANN